MCPPDPVTGAVLGLSTTQWAAVGGVLSVASFGLTAMGQMRQGEAQAAALRQQSQIAEFNARVAENNAILAQQAAEADADTIDRQRRIALAKQATGFAASGVVIDEGSTLEVLGDTAAEFEMDRLNRLHQGQVQSNAQRIQSTLDQNNAQGLLSQSSAARSAGRSAAVGTVLGGAGQLAMTAPIFGSASVPSARTVPVPGPLSAASGVSMFPSVGPS